MNGEEHVQPELGPVKDDVAEPDLSFVVRLRELYQHSGWTSLQSFADTVGYSRGTISRFLSGERRPKADFLDKVFTALEGKTGHPVTEEAQTSTRRLYFECIRTTRPYEYQAFELQEELKTSYWEHQAAERLIQRLNQDLRETRNERDQLDRQRRALEEAAARDTTERSQLQQRLTDEQAAYDRARNTLNEHVAEIIDTLRQAERDRDEARQTCEHLREQLRTAQIHAEDERQQLIDEQERQLREERERRESLERTLEEVLRNLTAPSGTVEYSGLDGQGLVEEIPAAGAADQGVANDATPIPQPSELLVAAEARRLRAHDAGERLDAVMNLASLMRELPHTAPEIVSVLCAYVRRARPADQRTVPDQADYAALQAIRERPHRRRTAVDLTGANLAYTDLSSAPLAGATLRGTVLKRVDLTGADLTGADLRGADLLGAKLHGTRLSGADLGGVVGLSSVRLQEAIVDAKTVLPEYLKRVRVRWRWVIVDVDTRPQSSSGEEQSIGRALTQARLRAGLTVEEVSAATRVRVPLVHAIERDDFTPCGGDVFARGHIRVLARGVGIDPKPLLEQYDAQRSGPPASTPVAALHEAERIPHGAAPVGPWDVSDVEDPDSGRIDLGGLFVPGVDGMELRVEVAGEDIVAATVVLGGSSAIQLQAFAAPESEGIWDEVRSEIATAVRAPGGIVDEIEGRLGWELRAQVPVQLPDGREGVQVVRFVGADGPCWLLRGVISGQAAVQPAAAAPLEAVFRDTVVVRGQTAMAARTPLTLTMPPYAIQAMSEDTALDQQPAPPSAETA